MKRIEAIIRHQKLEEVKNALFALGIQGITVMEVRGCGRQRGHKGTYRGAEYTVDFLPKVMLVLYVNDEIVPTVLDHLVHTARTGDTGDGKIAVMDLEEVIRVRTGEHGNDAL